jgi:peptidyl-prolyl cis-trans isomerase SurA
LTVKSQEDIHPVYAIMRSEENGFERRQQMKKIGLTGICLCVFTALGVVTFAEETNADAENINQNQKVIARVNGHPIYYHEVENRIDNFESKFREVNPEMRLPEDKRIQLREDFLDRMVREKIMELAAAEKDYDVEESEVDERIDQLQRIFGDGEEAEQRFLSGITDMKEFRQNIAKQIRIDKFIDSRQDPPEISQAEITEFYNQNPDRFRQEAGVKIQQISWRLPPKEDDTFSDTFAAAMSQAEDVMQEAQSGREFVELVRAYSEDPRAAETDGIVGWVQRGQLIEPLEKAVFDLVAGEVSQPILTDFGIYVVRALETRDSRQLPLEDVRDSIRDGLIRSRQGQSRERIFQELKSKAEIEILL